MMTHFHFVDKVTGMFLVAWLSFSGFSVGCIKRWSVTNLSLENNLPFFQLNAPIIITTKSTNKHCYLQPCTIEVHVIGGQRSVIIGPPFSLLSQWSSNQRLPVLHPSWSTPLRVSSGCAGPPSPDLVHCGMYTYTIQWSACTLVA